MKIVGKNAQQRTTGFKRALTHPVGLMFVGGAAFWIPFLVWWLLPRGLVQQRELWGHWSFIVLAPGAVWAAMYYWYRSVLPPARRTVRPAIWMGIVGPVISTWISSSVLVLMTELSSERFAISFNEITGILLEGLFGIWLYNAVVNMLLPQWIVVLGSWLVGLMLSRHFQQLPGGRNE